MNADTILTLGIILAAAAYLVYRFRSNRGCGCGCSGTSDNACSGDSAGQCSGCSRHDQPRGPRL